MAKDVEKLDFRKRAGNITPRSDPPAGQARAGGEEIAHAVRDAISALVDGSRSRLGGAGIYRFRI